MSINVVILPATRPLAPSAATARRVRRHCTTIMRSKPWTADTDRAELEHLLMRVLKTAGFRGVERVIRDAAVPALARVAGPPTARVRSWLARPPSAPAELRISIYNDRHLQSVSVTWAALPVEKPMTARARAKQLLQDQFYARYTEAGQRAYAIPPRRISAADRRILLVGEFEADVNNGGFSQYLGNKGRRRAAATLRVLEEIAAPKTAALLRAALADSNDESVLQKLDARFSRAAEDLAVLSMRDTLR